MINSKLKKVLVISHSFPPAGISAAQRPLKYTKFLLNFGWRPYVVTPKRKRKPLDYLLAKEIPEEISISEVFSLDPMSLNEILQEKYDQKSVGKIGYLFFKAILKIFSVIYYRMVVVDWYDGWIPFGLKKGREIINKEDIDLIYVCAEPHCSFVIGFLLKKFTGKPLVIDYGDSWTTSVYAKKVKGIKQRIRQYSEHKILKTADRVISVKKKTIEEVKESFPGIDINKFTLITHGYDPEDFIDLTKKKNSKFVITYTGRISEKFYYSPESFLYALGQLIEEQKILKDEISFIVIGTISSQYQSRYQDLIKKLDLQEVVINLGHFSHRKCIEYQMNSDLLLYIIESLEGKKLSYEFSGVLPAKIFEYIYTDIPILAIVPPGFEADLIKKTRTGFIAEPNNVSSVKKLLYELYQKHKAGTLKIEPNWKKINQYDRKYLTGKLAGVFDEVVLKKGRRDNSNLPGLGDRYAK
jgi:glycosyltransferase involved in cell wall biosynthesis